MVYVAIHALYFENMSVLSANVGKDPLFVFRSGGFPISVLPETIGVLQKGRILKKKYMNGLRKHRDEIVVFPLFSGLEYDTIFDGQKKFELANGNPVSIITEKISDTEQLLWTSMLKNVQVFRQTAGKNGLEVWMDKCMDDSMDGLMP